MTSRKPGLEVTKWFAFALMVGDHVNAYLLDYSQPLLYLGGRLVFPLFALCLAEGLAGAGQLRAEGVLKRLILWACVAQVPWSRFEHADALNVLFALACGLGVYLAFVGNASPVRRVLLGVVGLSLSAACEYGIAGCAVVVAAMWWREELSAHTWSDAAPGWKRWQLRVAPWAVAASLALLTPINITWFALLALPVFLALRYAGDVPRARHWFYGLYPAHLLVLAFVRSQL